LGAVVPCEHYHRCSLRRGELSSLKWTAFLMEDSLSIGWVFWKLSRSL
jgi:hypothetical protein